MGFKHRQYLSGNKVYSCSVCRTHMATIESMISRRFNGQHGQAYLFDAVFNTAEGEPEDRQMTTGLHRVRDLSCAKCGQTMGWKYERAYEQSQKYKEGKSILEKMLLIESTTATFMPSTSPSSSSASPPEAGIASPTHSAHAANNGWMSPYLSTTGAPFQAQLVNVGSLNSAAGTGSIYSMYTTTTTRAQNDRSRRSESAESEES